MATLAWQQADPMADLSVTPFGPQAYRHPKTSAPAQSITTLWRRPLVLISAALYALGLIVLLSPVTTGIPDGDRVSSGLGSHSRTCGVTLVQAFATPPPDVEAMSRESALAACTSSARGRVGYGLLLLLVAVPSAPRPC